MRTKLVIFITLISLIPLSCTHKGLYDPQIKKVDSPPKEEVKNPNPSSQIKETKSSSKKETQSSLKLQKPKKEEPPSNTKNKDPLYDLKTKGTEKSSYRKIRVSVKGMVCAFCAQGIEKKFKKKESIKHIEVSLDKMEVLLTLYEGKLISEAEIKKNVEKAGFKFMGLKYE